VLIVNPKAIMIYRVNRQDELIYMNEVWVQFALANDAPDLLPKHVLNRSLWQFITGETTRHLYREILQNVRAGRPMSFPFRCDAPASKRSMEMTILGRADGEVQFETRILQAQERPHQALLDRNARRAEDLLRICAWCKRLDTGGGQWAELEDAIATLQMFEQSTLPLLTHGMCKPCFEAMTEKIAEQRMRT
jgi:hypothetical protein